MDSSKGSQQVISEILKKAPDMSSDGMENDAKDSVYVFISLDMTNSTRFKVEQPKLWKKVIAAFYDSVLSAFGVEQYQPMLKNLSDSELSVNFWKFVGDEVLLYVNIYNLGELYSIVKAADESVKKLIGWISERIAKLYNCKGICLEAAEQYDCEFRDAKCKTCNIHDILKSSVGIKATMWIAMCSSRDDARNVVHVTSSVADDWSQNKTFDFLGSDIDEGFRIAKYSVKNRVLVSPFLANALYSNDDDAIKTDLENALFIVSYQQLKGIWNDRSFPIVMYFPLLKDIYSNFEYDELELPTYSEIKNSGIDRERCKVSYLEKIFEDVHLDEESNSIVDLLKNNDYKRMDEQFSNKPMEIHIACAVFNDSGMIMVHKHEKRGLEFGCIHISSIIDTWKDAVVNGYRGKYGMDILVSDDPVPIATYIYNKSNSKTALGIIVLGELQSSKTYNEFTPMSLEQIDSASGLMVDKFKENAKKAFQIYECYQRDV